MSIREQYAHKPVTLLEGFEAKLESTDVESTLTGRLAQLEEHVQRQDRLIRDLQGIVEHLNFKLARR
jgi:hypothetical protein